MEAVFGKLSPQWWPKEGDGGKWASVEVVGITACGAVTALG